MRRITPPAVVLFFLAPLLGELLSSSMPPSEWLDPFQTVRVLVLYGCGALLARELTHRWRKGWPTLLVLGAAYAIAEEGLLCMSFFNPNWGDLGPMADYGRWLGVNWVWAWGLTVYHALFSVGASVVLTGLLFPARRSEPWTRGWGLAAVAILFLGNLASSAFVISIFLEYRPPVVPYVGAVVAVIVLVAVARALPTGVRERGPDTPRAARPIWFALTGFLGTFAFFLCSFATPQTRLHPAGAMAVLAAVAGLAVWNVWRMSRGGAAWTDRHALALVGGAVFWFAAFALLAERDPNRQDNPAGMALVGLAAVVFMALVWWRVRRRTRRAALANAQAADAETDGAERAKEDSA
jgi:hypothetical protein